MEIQGTGNLQMLLGSQHLAGHFWLNSQHGNSLSVVGLAFSFSDFGKQATVIVVILVVQDSELILFYWDTILFAPH